jgi:phage terminase large subunit-like protein
VNNGGNLVIANIEAFDPTIHPFEVSAADGKRTRAEPVAGLYEQGKVHHVGRFGTLESQMTTWAALTKGERSPDRVDALVWGISYLMIDVEDLSLPARPVVPWNQGRRSYR